MRQLLLVVGVVLIAGCMETRYSRSSNVTNIGMGGGSAGISTHGESEARRWSGPWVGQPSSIQP